MIRYEVTHDFSKLKEHPVLKGVGLPDPGHSAVCIATDETGEVVAFWFMVEVVHIEPVWIAPSYRGSSMVRGLWRMVREVIDACGIRSAFCFSDRPDTADYLARLGLIEEPFRTFRYDAPKKDQ